MIFTWLSYGRNAMLISFSVFINLAELLLHNSLNNSSGQAAKDGEKNMSKL